MAGWRRPRVEMLPSRMPSPSLLKAIEDRVLLGDGAMGTEMQRAGLEPGGCGEAWNLDRPDEIVEIQRRYVEAGSDCLLSNTFGASRIMLERHDEAGRVEEINRAAVEIARRAFDGLTGFVLGDIGPFGGLMEPYGDIAEERVRLAFAEQARALVAAGADAIIIETQTALEELGLGIAAAREAGAPAVIGSLAFDRMQDVDDVRTMMGVAPEQAAEFMVEAGVDVLALNCGTRVDMGMAAQIVARYRSISSLPVMVQPNAGQPELEEMKVVYRETPEQMAGGVPGLLEAGVSIVGGCCGSTPAHIARLRGALNQLTAARR